MWEAMSALQSFENQTEKAALANDLFGRSASECHLSKRIPGKGFMAVHSE